MSDQKEFTGKTLDEAIQMACDHFKLERGKLEIDILSGGSTGIFGLMGVKKASIMARPRGKFDPLAKGEDKPKPEDKPKAETKPKAKPKREPKAKAEDKPKADKKEAAKDEPEGKAEAKADKPARSAKGRSRGRSKSKPKAEPKAEAPVEDAAEAVSDFMDDFGMAWDGSDDNAVGEPNGNMVQPAGGNGPSGRGRGKGRDRSSRGRGGRGPKPEKRSEPNGNKARPDRAERPQLDISKLDKNKLESTVRQVVARLLGDLVQAPQLSVRLERDKVLVFIEDEENSGIIIGREGQTLSALQYLTTRIVSRRMDAPVRVQLDTGDFRERQNEKLRDMAHELAAKAISTGKVQSTRPMSSYHRRVIHLALQDAPGVTTRSKGDGPTKRVLILPKKTD